MKAGILDLCTIKGSTFSAKLTITADTPIEFLIGDTIYFTIKETLTSATVAFTTTIVPTVNTDNIQLEISDEETESFDKILYIYDVVWQQLASGDVFKILGGNVNNDINVVSEVV